MVETEGRETDESRNNTGMQQKNKNDRIPSVIPLGWRRTRWLWFVLNQGHRVIPAWVKWAGGQHVTSDQRRQKEGTTLACRCAHHLVAKIVNFRLKPIVGCGHEAEHGGFTDCSFTLIWQAGIGWTTATTRPICEHSRTYRAQSSLYSMAKFLPIECHCLIGRFNLVLECTVANSTSRAIS